MLDHHRMWCLYHFCLPIANNSSVIDNLFLMSILTIADVNFDDIIVVIASRIIYVYAWENIRGNYDDFLYFPFFFSFYIL